MDFMFMGPCIVSQCQ